MIVEESELMGGSKLVILEGMSKDSGTQYSQTVSNIKSEGSKYVPYISTNPNDVYVPGINDVYVPGINDVYVVPPPIKSQLLNPINDVYVPPPAVPPLVNPNDVYVPSIETRDPRPTRNPPIIWNPNYSSYGALREERKRRKRTAQLLGRTREYLRKQFVEEGELLGGDEFDSMDGCELLGFSKAVSNEDIYILPFLIDGHKVQSVDDIQEYRDFLRGLFVDETELLGAYDFDSMNDNELLGFFKKLWKGIKKGVSSVGKFIGKVGKGIGKGVGKVVKVIGKGVGTVAKGIGQGVKFIGKGIGKVGKFVLDNAGGLLKAGLSFLPGGGVAVGLIDALTQSNQESTDQTPPVESTYDRAQPETAEEYYYPESETSETMPEAENVEYIEEYIPEEEYVPEEYVEGNFFDDVKKTIKNLGNPQNQLQTAGILTAKAESQIYEQERLKAQKLLSQQKEAEFRARQKTEIYGKGIWDTYGIYIVIGLGALLLLMNSNAE